MRKLILGAALTLMALAAEAQPYGNAERARLSATRTDKDLRKPAVHLGYINTNEVTLQQFMDNLEVGLTGNGFPDSRIISYTITIIPGKTEERTSDIIKGTRMPRGVFFQLHMDALKPGDVVLIEDIRVENDDHLYRVVEPVKLKII